MRRNHLASILQHVLLSSLASAPMLALTACGTSVGTADAAPDAAPDAAVDAPPVRADVGSCEPRTNWEDPQCAAQVIYPCASPPGIEPGMPVDPTTCARECPTGMSGVGQAFGCFVSRNPGGETELDCSYCAVGRRTEGLTEPAVPARGNALGEFLARNAALEAASVTAFVRLRDELHALGAPEALLAEVTAAAADERDHTEHASAAARRFGVEPPPAHIEPVAQRSRVDIARENAVEGCVRETFGALVAAWQAQRAEDPTLRALYARLAEDEARHAALSWDLDAWLAPQLDDAERAAVAHARREAIAGLYRGLDRAQDPTLVRDAGLPDALAARTLLDGLNAQLWRDAPAH